DLEDDRLDVVLLPLEVDLAVEPLVAAAAEPGGDDPVVVPPAGPGERLQQGLLRPVLLRVRTLGEVGDRPGPAAGGGRAVLADAHGSIPSTKPVDGDRRA